MLATMVQNTLSCSRATGVRSCLLVVPYAFATCGWWQLACAFSRSVQSISALPLAARLTPIIALYS